MNLVMVRIGDKVYEADVIRMNSDFATVRIDMGRGIEVRCVPLDDIVPAAPDEETL